MTIGGNEDQRPVEIVDSGLQPERTSLSWTRTVLALVVCALVMLRWSDGYPVLVFAILSVILVLAAWLYASNRARYALKVRGMRNDAARPATAQHAVLAISIATLAVGTAVLVAVG